MKILEAKKMKKTMIGYYVSSRNFKPIIQEMKEILDENGIDYNDLSSNSHITIAQIPGTYRKDDLKRKMDTIKPTTFEPKGLTQLFGKYTNMYYTAIEFKYNNTFVKELENIERNFEIVRFTEIKPHMSLFSTSNVIPDNVFLQLEEKIKTVKKIKTKEVSLFNRKFQIELKERI